MPKIFFDIKRKGYLSLGASPDRVVSSSPVYPSRFFLSTPKGSSMTTSSKYKDVPFLQEKLKSLKQLTRIYRETVTSWESSEPTYPLLPKVKEQLSRNEKLLKEVLCL